jgi:DTW domain-containing protein YfiP
MSRAYCYQCFRPNTACLCGKIKQVHNKPDIIILQHKDEVRHPTGSAIIADLYLQRCIRYVGEDFSCHREFNQILNKNSNNVFLVFPSVNALPLSLFKQKHAVDENTLSQYTFVFIDASWRKAKKIWYLSTNLHQLTAIELDEIKASNYRIRKEPEPGLVSTLESIVNLLSCLEPDSEKYQPLLEIFNEMIDHQIKCMGEEVYQKNYPC